MPRRAFSVLAISAALLTGCSGNSDAPSSPREALDAITPTVAPTTDASTPAGTDSSAPAVDASSSSAPGDSSAPAESGAGVPVTATPPLASPTPLTPEPKDSASPMEKVSYALEQEAIRTAKVSKKTSTTCNPAKFDTSKDVKVMCNVDYAGLKIPYAVDIRGGSMVFSYTAETTKGALVREAVLAEMANGGAFDKLNDVKCDVPPLSLVELDKPSGATCTYYRKVDPSKLVTVDVILSKLNLDFEER